MSSLCLFHMPGACSRVAMNALEEIGLSYDERPVNLFKGEQRSPELLAVNPKGKVPAIRIGDALLTENPSILLYLHEAHPDAHLLPAARDAIERAGPRSDLIWISNTLHPLARIILMPGRAAPGDPQGARTVASEQFAAILAGVEARLGSGPWWYGDTWSITDVYLVWCIGVAAGAGFDLTPFPAIGRHIAQVRARPSFQRTLAREQAALDRAAIELPPGVRL